MRSLATVAALFAAATSALAQQPQPAPTSASPAISLRELEQLATASNPTLRAAQARVDAARGLSRQAGAWPNPTIGATAEEVTFSERDPRGQYGFFAEQTFVLGGKLQLRRDVFDRTADRALAELELQQQRILSSVRATFYEALALDRRVEVNEK